MLVLTGNPGVGKHTVAEDLAKTLDYEIVDINKEADIAFYNRPINCKAWWMCDLRDPEELQNAKIEKIFLCNKEYIKKYKKNKAK